MGKSRGSGVCVLIAIFLLAIGGWAAWGAVLFNELMYHPADGDDYEYIELFNTGPEACDLTGFYFNDGIDYTFTQTTILPAGSYLVIARSNVFFRQKYPLVTNVAEGSYVGKLDNGGERVCLADAGGALVCELDYSDDPPWPIAADGAGASLEFNQGASDPAQATNWHAGYTGGSPGASNAPPINARSVRINELLPSNVATIEDPDYSKYPDWVELYNDSDLAVDLSGHYLTDDLDEPTKWTLPPGCIIEPHGYLIFWADGAIYATINHGYHLPFKFSADGEEAVLVAPDGRVIDAVKYDAILSDVSYGRIETNSLVWAYFSDPTPGAVNSTPSVPQLLVSEPPVFSVTAGFHTGPQLVTIESTAPGAIIHYTTNGATPDYYASTSTGSVSLTVNTTQVIRARAYEPGKLTSPVVTHTFLINEETELPVVSISMNPEYLWDDNIGIYVQGTNGAQSVLEPGYFNFYQDWERPTHIEFFENTPSPERVANLDAGMELHGFASRGSTYPHKGLRIKMDNRYGDGILSWQVYRQIPRHEYSELVLRNGGCPDAYTTNIRDGFLQDLAQRNVDMDCQTYRPTLAFLNGVFWGMYRLCEKYDEDYFRTHYDYTLDDIDFIGEGSILEAGDWTHYDAMESFAASNTLPDDEAYAYLQTLMDVNEHINYWVFQIFIGNADWPEGNIKCWRPRIEGGRWRWMLIDNDYTFSYNYDTSYSVNHLLRTTSTNDPNTRLYHNATLFRNLLTLSPYRNEYIQRAASYMNTFLSTDNLTNELTSLVDYLEPVMTRHVERWWTNGRSIFTWHEYLDDMYVFAQQRPTYMRQHIMDHFDLAGTYTLTLGATPEAQGSVLISHALMPSGWSTNIYFQDIPITLQAVPAIGHRFVRWEGVPGDISNATATATFSADTTVQAIFERTAQSLLPTTITNTLLLEPSGNPYYALGDITVPSNSLLHVEPGVEILMPENASIVVHGRLLLLGSSEFPIQIGVNPENNAREHLYPHYRNEQPPTWGAICLDNTSEESIIRHVRITDATHGQDTMRFKAVISAYRSDLTIEDVTITNVPFPIFTQYGNITVRRCHLHADDTCDYINIKYADSALTEDCVFYGNEAFDTDAIDYDEVAGGIIRNNQMFDFTGDNSDGVDLGEGASSILVQSNLIFNCADKGISIGQASSAIIEYNIIHDCAQGVAVKDEGSYAYVNHNTFYNNGTAVACFEKNLARGGGQASVRSSILSASTNASFVVDEKSGITIMYSLSDTDPLPGTGNLQAHPMFRDAPSNLAIGALSPCRDTGDPASPLDPDGTRADMGALYYIRMQPTVQIITPCDASEFLPYETIHLSGTGQDDDFLPLTNFSWAEETSGYLGDGALLDVSALPVGNTTFVLYGIDNQNMTGQTMVTVSIALDSDTNGLPDAWEEEYWPEGDSGGATNDFDQDGLSNEEEWISGSNPTNPASVFTITGSAFQSAAPGIEISWPSVAGRYYTLAKRELGQPSFITTTNQWSATPPLNTVTLSVENSPRCLQYRIHVNR